MKLLNITLATAALALLSAPAVAQLGSNDGFDFITAVQKRDGDKATELVEKHPTIIDTKDDKGDTGLIIAIRGDDTDWTGFLLRKGADPNLAGAGGDTPLIAAAKTGFDQAVGWLLGLGAKVDMTNRKGETPLIIAVQQRQLGMVRVLLAAGANPDKADSAAGLSARDYARRDGRSRDIISVIEAKKPKASAATSH